MLKDHSVPVGVQRLPDHVVAEQYKHLVTTSIVIVRRVQRLMHVAYQV
jgi:hypothetical protein